MDVNKKFNVESDNVYIGLFSYRRKNMNVTIFFGKFCRHWIPGTCKVSKTCDYDLTDLWLKLMARQIAAHLIPMRHE